MGRFRPLTPHGPLGPHPEVPLSGQATEVPGPWPLVVVQLLQHGTKDLLVPLRLPLVPRALLIAALLLGMMVFGVRQPVEFFYFQF